MTHQDHLRFGPDRLALDDVTAERLLRGLDAADAPPPYGATADLLSALRTAPRPSELAAEDAVLVAMAAGLALADPPDSPRRTRMLKKFLSTRFAAAAAIGVLSMGGVAAAASGSVQTALSSAVSPLADVVTGNGSTTSTTVANTTSTTVGDSTSTTVAGSGVTGTTDTTVAGSTTPALTPEQQAACDAATNHGEYVSSVAHDHSVTGAQHGQAVSEAAHSDCGKHAAADGTTDTTISGTTGTSTDAQDQTEVEQPDTQDAAKATKPAAKSTGKSHGGGKSGQHGKK